MRFSAAEALWIVAQPVDLKPAALHDKAHRLCLLVDQINDLTVVELENAATVDTDQVIVLVFGELRVITRVPIIEVTRICKILRDEQLERSINRRITDARQLLSSLLKQLVDANVLIQLDKLTDNDVSLSRGLHPHILKPLVKSGHRLFHFSIF